MNIKDLIRIVSATLATLNSAKATATSLGDLDRIVQLDANIEETQATLASLRSLTE